MPATQSTSLTLPASVVRAAKRLAKRQKRSVSDVVTDALNKYEASLPVKSPETVEEWARFIEEVQKQPYTQEEFEAEERHLNEVGVAQAKRLGIKRDSDIDRIVNESRARRRAAASRTRH